MTKLFIFLTLFTMGFATEVEAANAPKPSLAPEETGSFSERKSSFSLELLGRAGLYSFNYDYLLNDDLALGAGVATYSVTAGSSNASAWILPVYANYYVSKSGPHRLYATGGLTLITASGNLNGDSQIKGSGIGGTIGGGYEYKSADGFLFRAAPYLLLGQASGIWLGISLGYSI